MAERDFASRILEECGGDDYLLIEKLLRLRSDSLANQFKTKASAILHANNRQYAPVSETITTNNHDAAAGTSVGKVDASDSDDVLHSKNRQCECDAAKETIATNKHEIVAGRSVRKILKIKRSDGLRKVVCGNSSAENNETATKESNNADIKNNETTAEESYSDYERNKKVHKIEKIAGMFESMLDHNVNPWDEMRLKNQEIAAEEIDNPNTTNSETAAEKIDNPNTKNKETAAEEFDNPDTKKNNETVDEESSFDKKIKANKKRSNKRRKKKNNNNGSISHQREVEEPGLPLEFKEKIEQMGGIEVKLVIQKKLTKTDVTRGNSRLAIPKGKIKESFLTPDEESYLDYERNNKEEKIAGMYVSLLDHNLNLWDEMILKKWKMETAELYNITEGWNELVAENKWNKDEEVEVQLWSFRRNHKLNFALVKL
ncbi:B3 domain-containing protein At1g05920-like [Vicia villosa]|uniref:B3 domain-containing protein At1g05920-like n=1 Tax=Vicia villosa TaxID=3911 RepID=UPI00273CD97A|nr:B3 domain-containing protein At1g05920-like [Vicia villosa]